MHHSDVQSVSAPLRVVRSRFPKAAGTRMSSSIIDIASPIPADVADYDG